jgi:hypothetical protein
MEHNEPEFKLISSPATLNVGGFQSGSQAFGYLFGRPTLPDARTPARNKPAGVVSHSSKEIKPALERKNRLLNQAGLLVIWLCSLTFLCLA